jgi:hypothetical protein
VIGPDKGVAIYGSKRTGQTATVDATPPIIVLLSQNGQVLIAEHTAPTVENHLR